MTLGLIVVVTESRVCVKCIGLEGVLSVSFDLTLEFIFWNDCLNRPTVISFHKQYVFVDYSL